MKKIQVGVIGSGMMGTYHIEAVRRIPNAEVVALCDPNEESGRAVCEREGIPNYYLDYKKMLQEINVDVVHNCTPNHLHYSINKYLIENGINVYCEKPLALNSVETEELCRLAEEKGAYVGVNFNYRHNTMVREFHERIKDKGTWGRTFFIRAQYLQDWMQMETDFNWRCLSQYGGKSRTVADIGSHCFDLIQFITGQKICRVFAEFRTIYPQRKKAKGETKTFSRNQQNIEYELVDIDTEDMAVIMFEMEDGTLGCVELSQISSGTKNNLEIAIDGSNYAMQWNQENADKMYISSRDNVKQILYSDAASLTGDAVRYATLPAGHPVGWADALHNAIREFYNTVCNGSPVNYTIFADGDNIVRIVEACLKSNELKEWVIV